MSHPPPDRNLVEKSLSRFLIHSTTILQVICWAFINTVTFHHESCMYVSLESSIILRSLSFPDYKGHWELFQVLISVTEVSEQFIGSYSLPIHNEFCCIGIDQSG